MVEIGHELFEDEMMDDQRVEWKLRLIRAIIHQQFDCETLVRMLEAGLNQAHSEGLEDAAHVCQKVADGSGDRVAEMLARNIRKLDKMNIKNRATAEANAA